MTPERLLVPEHHSISDDDRLLTEVDHLLRSRLPSGDFDPAVLSDIHQNLSTAIQEQAMPAAVTETRHELIEDIEKKKRIFMWMGKTAVQNAMSGYSYHRHQSALARVDVEVDEAEYSVTQDADMVRVFISPRMTRKDATLKEAREEHLDNDDAVRVSWLETHEGKTERVLQSLLVKDVPFEAWVAMLEDGDNVFNKSIALEDRESALSVMKVHKQLERSKGVLRNGPVSIVEAIVPYISDPTSRKKVIEQVRNYLHKDQEQMKHDADAKADEWLEFEKELAESLAKERATETIHQFVTELRTKWSAQDLEIIQQHTYGDTLKISRRLAAVLESAEQRILAGRAAVLADEEFVLKQVGSVEVLKRMQDTERLIVIAQQEGMNHQIMVQQQNRLIAERNIKAGGGGCAGTNTTSFKNGILTDDIFSLPDPIKKDFEILEDEEGESDEFGHLDFLCTECHPHHRELHETIDRCAVPDCKGTVGCAEPEEPSSEKQKEQQKVTGFALLFGGVKVKNEQFTTAA